MADFCFHCKVIHEYNETFRIYTFQGNVYKTVSRVYFGNPNSLKTKYCNIQTTLKTRDMFRGVESWWVGVGGGRRVLVPPIIKQGGQGPSDIKEKCA